MNSDAHRARKPHRTGRDTHTHTRYRLDGLSWPDPDRFLINRSQAHVGDTIIGELTRSQAPLVVARFTGIAMIVDVVDNWPALAPTGTVFRIVLGSEPFTSNRQSDDVVLTCAKPSTGRRSPVSASPSKPHQATGGTGVCGRFTTISAAPTSERESSSHADRFCANPKTSDSRSAPYTKPTSPTSRRAVIAEAVSLAG